MRNNQRGAVSLITVIILAIILSVITTGLLRLSIRDARQALDDDLTNRAFFAAESGLNDAVRFIEQVQDDPSFEVADLNGDDCDPPVTADPLLGEILAGESTLDVEYVCQLIDMTPTEVRNTITEDDSTQIKLPAGAASNLVLKWHRVGDDGSTVSNGNFRNSTNLPAVSDWNNLPALMRVNIFSNPNSGNYTRDDINNDVIFLNPANSGSTINSVAADGQVVNVRCDSAGTSPGYDGFVCRAVINISDLSATRDHYVRMTPIYAGAQTSVSFEGGEQFEGVQALVDVTGRAGDVFRRVQASVSLEDSTVNILPDAGVSSGLGLCKQVTISDDFSDTCPDLSTP